LPWTPKATRGVTADEFRAEVWHAVIHGVKGVIYFPQRIGEGFAYDATPARVAREMVTQNARLNELREVLAGEMNPKGVGVAVERPLETGWRVVGGEVYVIVLNFSDEAVAKRAIKLSGVEGARAVVYGDEKSIDASGGTITDDFGPYGVKVYRVRIREAARD
jgi:hypothetical protein